MPGMNGTGPEGKGPRTGRGLGKDNKLPEEETLEKLGKGQGKRRKAGGGQGKGKRMKGGRQD